MGLKIEKLLAFAETEQGMLGKTRVAMKLGKPWKALADSEDTPDLVSSVKAAIKEIIGKDAPNV